VQLDLKKYFRTASLARDPTRQQDPTAWLPLLVAPGPEMPIFRLRKNLSGEAPRALPLDTSNWDVKREPIPGEAGGEQLTFQFEDGDGHRFEKVIRLHPGRYDLDLELRFHNLRPGPTQGTDSYLLLGAAGIWDERSSPFQSAPAAVVTEHDPEDLRVLDAKTLKDAVESVHFEPREELAPVFGLRSAFFGFALAPDPASAASIETISCSRLFDPHAFAIALEKKEQGGKQLDATAMQELRVESESNVATEAALSIPFPAGGAAPHVVRCDVFGGPKSPEMMRDSKLAPFRILYEVEYGSRTSLRWINRALLWWMRAMHSLTHNWGVAIILLTLTVKILLFPLNRLQSRTMEQFQKKMKLLQPQLDELKKKYKGNLQKLNVEQQKIMREHGVRPPIFGCLVVFLQMPVWYGLFQIMRSAPELRHAPFMLWIGDLSAPDVVPLPFTLPIIGTLHLLPILMVIAWLAQNRMMPKPTDPQQAQMQKMMNFFPFMMGFFLYSYASGQSLYMLTNSLLGMLQMKLLRVTPTN
jgi:YidC/Oxa1 family membrane protein insertase